MKKVILDANIFIRFLIKDILSQYKTAEIVFREIEEGKITGLVSVLVINEIIWILENYYHLERNIYLPQITKLLALKRIKLMETKKNVVIEVLEKMVTTNIDFTDLYLFRISQGIKIVSFDKDFRKLSS